MDMKSTKKKAMKHPPIPKFLGAPKPNPYHERLGVRKTPMSATKLYEPVTWPAVGWSMMVVIGLGILCWTAYKLAELFATPCVYP